MKLLSPFTRANTDECKTTDACIEISPRDPVPFEL